MGNIRLAPIQMKQMVYTKFHIETSGGLEKTDELWAPSFNFDGVAFDISQEIATNTEQGDDPTDFMVTLNLDCPGKDENGKTPPYNISLSATAWFEVAPSFPKDKRHDLVQINGSSIIYSSMREALTLTTGRLLYGALTLPSIQFIAEKQESPQQ